MANSGELDIEADENGTYLVSSRNKRRLLYDGLLDTFSKFGKIVTVCNNGNKGVHIRFEKKDSALACYYELNKNPDFMVDLPHKYYIKDIKDLYVDAALDTERRIGLRKAEIPSHLVKMKVPDVSENKYHINSPELHFVFRKRKIMESRAFNRLIITFSAIHQYLDTLNQPKEIMPELEYQMRGVSLKFETGFKEEIEQYNFDSREIPQLIPAKDLYYFRSVKKINATDVLICNLPPWYEEIDAYKLVIPLIPDDLLRIDWYRMYPAGTDECTYPYGIIYVKSHRAACVIRHATDELVIGERKLSVCLMQDVENLLINVRKNILKLNTLPTNNGYV